MIPALLKYAEDAGLTTRVGYAPAAARHLLTFSEGGQYLGIVSLGEGKAGKTYVAPQFASAEKKRVRPKLGGATDFLLAPAEDVLGLAGDKPEKVAADHGLFVRMLEESGHEGLARIAASLRDEATIARIRNDFGTLSPKASPNDGVTLRIGDETVIESEGWQAWWESFRTAALGERATEGTHISLATGELVVPATTHPMTSGLAGVGANGAGAAFITFDKQAFLSYGLDKGSNAPMSEESAKAYIGALNHLISQGHTLGGARVLHWYSGPGQSRETAHEIDPVPYLWEYDDEEDTDPNAPPPSLRAKIERLKTGDRANDLVAARFHLVALSGAGGRVMVRDHYEGEVPKLLDAIDRWFADLTLVRFNGSNGPDLRLESVMTAPLLPKGAKSDYKKWIAPAGAWRQGLWRAAVSGTPFPAVAALRALDAHTRAVVKGDLTSTDAKTANQARSLAHRRLALIKAWLIRSTHTMEPTLMDEHPSAAYHCGRLLSLFDSLQRAALGDVGAGVVQRYYAGAMTHPAGVFNQLTRLAQTHLDKLDDGLAFHYKERIAKIHVRLGPTYPSSLVAEDQAFFALGYWHQTAASIDRIRAASAAKKEREAAASTSAPDSLFSENS